MPRGAKSVIATLYIRRKTTLKATIACLVVVGGAAFAGTFLPTGEAARPGVEVGAVSMPAKPMLENSNSDPKGDHPLAGKPPAVVLPEAAALVDPTDPAATIAVAKNDDGDTSDLVSRDKAPEERHVEAVEQKTAPIAALSVIRQIIPIAEGLDLYRKPEAVGPAHVTPAATAQQEEGKVPFALPTSGIPSEEDLSSFLPAAAHTGAPSQQQEASADIAVIPPEEDMSPTIALPDVVPAPVARPAPSVAAGQPVEFRIDQGPGIKSGFWLGDRDDPKARRFFVIVTAYLASGEKTNWKFTNIVDGSAADTSHMAVEVTEDTFIALAKEAKEGGMVKEPVLGRSETESKAPVKWRIATVRGNLLAGWEK
jgi:hypothetical protein